MRVLLLTNLFPTPRDQNRGLFTAQLAREMARQCDLRVAVPLPWMPPAPLGSLLPERYREFAFSDRTQQLDGVRVDFPRYLMVPKISERWHAGLMYAGLRRYAQRLHREFPFEVINAQWLYPDGVAAVRLGQLLKVPVVLTGLGCDVNEFIFTNDKGRQTRQALEAARAVTVVSNELAAVLDREGLARGRVTTIANGVDTHRFSPGSRAHARQELGLAPEQSLVVCISRLSHEKGVHVLIEAAATLARECAVTIAIVGEGVERDALTARINTLGLAASIRLIGAVPHATVPTWLTAADVVCMPSLREGHPNAAMEALACGRPLVASGVGALKSMITEGLGLLVEPSDPSALAGALRSALEQQWDPARISASVANASWAATATSYVRTLHNAAASHGQV